MSDPWVRALAKDVVERQYLRWKVETGKQGRPHRWKVENAEVELKEWIDKKEKKVKKKMIIEKEKALEDKLAEQDRKNMGVITAKSTVKVVGYGGVGKSKQVLS